MPKQEGRLRHPVVVLVGGAGAVDRDETVADIPIFGQLAGALADRGFMVLRYDKRGVGQSGGRVETVTLQDYADDAIAIVKWLARRDDVDPRRIAVLGYGEGGAAAMLAAAREKKIASLVLVAANGTSGADLVLEQQRHQLDLMKTSDAERQAKIDLQQRVQTAVHHRQRVGGHSRRTSASRRTRPGSRACSSTTRRKMMPDVAADPDRPGRSRHAGAAASCRTARRARAPAQEGAACRSGPPARREPSPRQGHDRRGRRISDAAPIDEIAPDVATTIADWLRR